MTDPRRRIPGVDALLESPEFAGLLDRASRSEVATAVRAVQERLRAALAPSSGTEPGVSPERVTEPGWLAERVAEELDRRQLPSLRGVLNATGVVLHTNLGRAPLADAAVEAVRDAAAYGTLEYDVETGRRGSRYDHCIPLLRELTGAEDALVVNNNAAAVVLVLNTLAEGREAVISRGELVEIGGSFRVPEIMARSGVRMREVGSTNRTHRRDYAAALGSDTALLLKVHRSNFRVEGFTADVEPGALADLASDAGVPLVHDLGSGALLDLTDLGLPHEVTAREALAAGADVVTMSGDKLLGGPQAGIILGTTDAIAAMRTNPLARAVRPDKLTLAALEATLALYREPHQAVREIPVLRMLGTTRETLWRRAEQLAARLDGRGVPAEVVAAEDAVGGGAYPGVTLPGAAVAVTPAGPNADAHAHAARLRQGPRPVIGRVRDGRLLLHPRTVSVHDEALLLDRVAETAASGR